MAQQEYWVNRKKQLNQDLAGLRESLAELAPSIQEWDKFNVQAIRTQQRLFSYSCGQRRTHMTLDVLATIKSKNAPLSQSSHLISSHLAVVGNLDKWHCRNSAKTGFRQLQPVGSELFDKGVGKLVAKPTTRSSERRQQELSR